MQKVNMTDNIMVDKNGKEITIGAHCIINDNNIGVVKNIVNDKVSVLLLSDDGETCLEKTVSGDCIDIR